MKLILLRHAARSTHGLGDASLNATGERQAEELARQLAPQGSLPIPARLFASPKKRAQETLRPISATSHVDITIDARLDERHQNETGREFEARVRAMLTEVGSWEKSLGRDGAVYLCSHMDWLELAMQLVPAAISEIEMSLGWSHCEYRVFKIASEGPWTLTSSGAIHTR